MSDDAKHIKALRDAFVEGAQWDYLYGRSVAPQTEAARRFPMPTVEVPRVVRCGDFEYRINSAGVVQWRYKDSAPWCPYGSSEPANADTLRDLLALPTVTVPADSPEAADA